MREFQVPQFITIEDKVIGPFTIKQFLYLGSGVLLILFLKSIFTGYFLYLLAVLIGALAAALAFLKVNEQSAPVIIRNAVRYFVHPRLYVWKKQERKTESSAAPKAQTPDVLIQNIPKLSESKLSDLAWSLDLKEKQEKL